MGEKCIHLIKSPTSKPKSTICQGCEKEHLPWVALRCCTECGYVGCCESSLGKHSEKHYQETGHPVIESMEDNPWKWCYVHKKYE
ncbi:MAG: hypothetical protein GWN01_05085 [Nitrosopumilaceae archaeon]|nr:hypothetical protein [Nitrosopumilaceae archaeon]NIU00318.1 hypothetical protein [Nitrosopumilaceae archaeon]NIU86720.1 hypothetical protein [Nitrosopumilaceae archaeon]NIV65421.1 hypothetical protein [Nitrosopumilaceae archaeon]NIX60920.1 hypothetical protein [Nitrosopumilaceae archaeon]